MPARSNSLFFTERAITPARRLSWSSTANSDFGMVKLSRTSFSFFTSFLGLAVGVFLAVLAGVAGLEAIAVAGVATLGATALADMGFRGAVFWGAVLEAGALRAAGLAAAALAAASDVANFGAVDVALALAMVFDAGTGEAGAFCAAACLTGA